MLATLPLTFMLGSIGVFDMVFTAFLFGADRVRARRGAAGPPAASVCVVRAVEPCGDDQGAGRARAGRLVLSRRTRVRPGMPHGAAVAALGDRRHADACCCRCRGSSGCTTRSAGTSCTSTRLRAICTTSRSRSRFRTAHSITRCTCRRSSPASSRGASSCSAARSTRSAAGARGDQDSARRDSAVGVGRRRVRVLQPGALQGRSLCLSGRARVLPAGGAGVDEPQRLPARSRGRARQHVRALVRRRSRRHSRCRRRSWPGCRCSTSGSIFRGPRC